MIALFATVACLLPQDPPSPASFDLDAVVKAVDEGKDKIGLRGVVVGVLQDQRREIVVRGESGSGRPLDGDTLFEIGSITKVFTALLLALAVEAGEVALETPVGELLPDGVTVPARGRAITLLDLATHRSSLPRMPANMRSKNALDPFADYGAGQLYAFLVEHELRRDVGSQYEYSNLGSGLLGHALARRADANYAELLAARLTKPLGLADTTLAPDAAQSARLATPHAANGSRVLTWHFDVLAGCGALRSTANDLLRFAACNLGLVETPLLATLRAAHAPRQPALGPAQVALGWHVTPWGDGDPVVWHNGRTGGYGSILLLRPKWRTAVVVLANQTKVVDELGTGVLRAMVP